MTFSFTPIIGGALIGLSATILLAFHGKVAGISGIFSGALSGEALSWRAPFLLGLLASGVIVPLTGDQLGLHEAFSNSVPRTLWVTGLAGLLVGFGTRLGSGCTSGHGSADWVEPQSDHWQRPSLLCSPVRSPPLSLNTSFLT